MALIDDLREQNRWWFLPESVGQDYHLQILNEKPFQHVPDVLKEVDFDSSYVYTLRGPRQVGKTTSMKMLIRELLEKAIDSKAVIYFSLDLVTDHNEIVEIIRSAKSLTSDVPGRRYFFLDEISSVPHWQRAIKFVRDTGLASDDFFLLTGSSAADIGRGADRLPGRRGQKVGLDKILLPLSFAEFCRIRKVTEYVDGGKVTLNDFLSATSEHDMQQGMLMLAELQKTFTEYLTVGGFPQAVGDFLTKGSLKGTTIEMLWSIIAGDIERWGRKRILAMKLMERISQSLGTVVSWNRMAQAVGFASPATAQDYVELLSNEFALLVLYFYDQSKSSVSLKKGKKIYFTDPLFHHLWSLINRPYRQIVGFIEEKHGRLAEAVVGMELFRSLERQKVEAFSMPQHLYYWRSTRHKEIDFLTKIDNSIIPVEVKY